MPSNPFTMRGRIDRCWLFTFRTPTEEAQALLPAPLKAVAKDGFAFWNVVVCRIQSMRPAPLPASLGISYWHAAYRLYVRLPVGDRPTIEGLHFLRSDAGSRLISSIGNWLTDFRFHLARIDAKERADGMEIVIESPDAPARVILKDDRPAELSGGSPFRSLEEAAAYLKYKPFGISIDEQGRGRVVRITRDEAAWKYRLVHVERAEWRFLSDKHVAPEICYEVDPIEYQWNRAETYLL